MEQDNSTLEELFLGIIILIIFLIFVAFCVLVFIRFFEYEDIKKRYCISDNINKFETCMGKSLEIILEENNIIQRRNKNNGNN